MQAIRKSYRGLSLLFDLNGDRIISLLALMTALFLAAWLTSEMGAVMSIERI